MIEQKFNTDLLTGFGPDKLISQLSFEEMESGFDCGGGTYKVTKEEVAKFAQLMGDPNTGDVTVPVGMIYIYGLRICWDRQVFLDDLGPFDLVISSYGLLQTEIEKLAIKIKERGYALIPLDMHFKDGWVKVTLGLAKGRKQYDNRHEIRAREERREMRNAADRQRRDI